ncbi:class I SAM-dependent methyltransferase [Gracilibacillus lacisalsi]|uniref:class I SAM-dependent methyltransferase n=1 Tax=Gracilibacillus lacisalsi TaxID=393087 RepID=UPI000360DF50|nr:class I SAM-dependent methyltransferase [Gracilibacillus lacisalsi]
MVSYQELITQIGMDYTHPGGKTATDKWLKQIPKNPKKVLEVGCGTGETLRQLRDQTAAFLYGIDSSANMVTKAKNKTSHLHHIEIMQQNIEDLSFTHHFFDLIISESVLAFTPIHYSLPKLTNLLKPNGQIVLLEMATSSLLTHSDEEIIKTFYQLPQLLSKEDWLKQLLDYGYETVYLEKIEKEPKTPSTLPQHLSMEMLQTLNEHYQLNTSYANDLHTYLFIAKKRGKNDDHTCN